MPCSARTPADLRASRRRASKIADDLAAALKAGDVLIDFTVPEASLGNLKACAEQGKAIVIGSTGFTKEQLAEVEQATSRRCPACCRRT